MERTSETHPLIVASVEIPGGGRIGMTLCPGKKQARARMAHLSLPIPDYGLPGPEWEAAWETEGLRLRSILRRGGRICLHCMGGLGRSGTIAARLLVELGVPPEDAIRSVRAARPGAVKTKEQEEYVRAVRTV